MKAPAKIWMSVLVLASAAAATETGQTRRFSIPGHGSLVLEVPQGWRVASQSLAEPPAGIVPLNVTV